MTLTHPASPAERAAAALVERALIDEVALSAADALTLQRLLVEHRVYGEGLVHAAKQRDDVRFELGRVAAELDAARELLVHKSRLLDEAIARLRGAAVELELLRAQVKS